MLDPACGTGNFLYVSLELMKRLEGEVLEALLDLGGQEALRGLGSHSVDPHQFLGLEINPRAAAIAELVLWIGSARPKFLIIPKTDRLRQVSSPATTIIGIEKSVQNTAGADLLERHRQSP